MGTQQAGLGCHRPGTWRASGSGSRAAVSEAYTHEPRGDEFLEPIIFYNANEQRVRDGDVILWFNFRADRARQLSIAFLSKDFAGFNREVTPAVHFVTLTEYDKTYGCPVVFKPQSLADILVEVVSKANLAQLRIAETEKYPHVTYFFNGGLEKQYPGEDRVIVPSPKDVPTYDYKPEMSAPEVTAKVVENLPKYDLVILNFANPDMVGHTGIVEAGVQAVETIDQCVKVVVEKTLSLGGELSSRPTTAIASRCAIETDHRILLTPRISSTSSTLLSGQDILGWRAEFSPMLRRRCCFSSALSSPPR